MNDDILRDKVKLVKAIEGISYKDIAQYLDITQGAFYNWIRGSYKLSPYKNKLLKDWLDDIL